MTEVRVAGFADDLLTNHPVAGIPDRLYIVRSKGQPKAGPARSGIIFVLGAEQFHAAADTAVDSVRLVFHVLAGKRALRTFILRNLVLLVAQPVAQFVGLFAGFAHLNIPRYPAPDFTHMTAPRLPSTITIRSQATSKEWRTI